MWKKKTQTQQNQSSGSELKVTEKHGGPRVDQDDTGHRVKSTASEIDPCSPREEGRGTIVLLLDEINYCLT